MPLTSLYGILGGIQLENELNRIRRTLKVALPYLKYCRDWKNIALKMRLW